MGYFDIVVLGLKLWMWNGLIIAVIGSIFIYAIIFPEKAKAVYYRKRYPERVIKVIVHFKSGFYKIYWRLQEHDNLFRIKKKDYLYDTQTITKEHDFFVAKKNNKQPSIWVCKDLFTKREKGKELITLGHTKEYEFNKLFSIKQKGKKFPEIHYIYNNPNPLRFDFDTPDTKGGVEFSSHTLQQFKENDLFETLLKLKGEKALYTFIVIILFVILAVVVFMLSQSMGWF